MSLRIKIDHDYRDAFQLFKMWQDIFRLASEMEYILEKRNFSGAWNGYKWSGYKGFSKPMFFGPICNQTWKIRNKK
jgi:hypothetical protein